MHVRNEQIHAAVIVEVEKLQPHTSPGCLGKTVLRFLDEFPAALIFEIVSRTLHVQEINARPAVTLQIREACVATPASRIQAHLRSDILELIVSQILVENRVLEPFGMEMAGKRVLQADVSPFWAFFVCGINADVTNN